MKKYSDEEKQAIIKYSVEYGLSAAKRKYSVWPETIRYWSRQDVRESHNKKALNAYHTRYKQDESHKAKRKEYYSKTKKVPYYKKTLDYTYTITECRKELINLKKSQPSYDSLPTRNRIIHTHQPHFFYKEQELWKNKDIRKKLLDNRTKYLNKTNFSDREILRGFKISGIHTGYSHFSPLWIAKFIEEYNPVSIYDPCGGWGHRLIGCYLCGVKYIYNDLWDKTYNGCREISKFLQYDCTLYNNDCTTFTPQDTYDCVFTCPPYNNIEVYNDTPIQAYNVFLRNMVNAMIKDTVTTIGIVINLTHEEDIVHTIPRDFKQDKRILLGTTHHTSHFNKEKSNKQEILLVFKRHAHIS